MTSPTDPFRVVVVGAGFAGTATAVQLLRAWRGGPLELTLLERSGRFGPGVAFSTPDAQHLLNVNAAGMSALPDAPRDFLDWLHARDTYAHAGTFAPRVAYGAYLQELLAQTAANAAGEVVFTRSRDEAVRIVDGGATVLTRSGAALPADAVVLAVGVNRPRTPPGAGPELLDHPGYVADPWDHDRIAALADRDRVLIVGSGLTMIDVAMSLCPGDGGPELIALSRRGVLPRAHHAEPPAHVRPFRPPTGPLTADRLAAHVENAALAEVAAGGDWRSVVDGVRPYTQQLWQSLPLGEQARFLARHARRWEIHRHRMAPGVAERLRTLRDEGRLSLRAGSLQRLDPAADGGIDALYKTADGVEALHVDAVVNCTGPDPSPGADGDPLLSNLIADRLGRAGPLGLGLDTDADGQLCDCDGHPSGNLFTLGALRRGQLWETTAVPEIRLQAADLANLLAARGAALCAERAAAA
ncbi:FAD/NAD(P)-binding protein [Conexibacter sp. CPCC 206217]|uniref:FAD/NAD(P)-binding protein n=1 Tax=Conexibacter sp. CPCC 206217 TaxID=3064574 RepID=UPI0027202FFC|nr:FAD/NAD(P)-binding protein [Conexibacter sp. CPCC 206217]MDO8210770.1 FAD/NAD(P)-binding protein [Conexibacter sp. CPCC 206217]